MSEARRMRPLDTTPEADAVHLDGYRRMSGAERVAIIFRLNDALRRLSAAGIRHRHPDYDATEVASALRRLWLGADLARRAFPDDPVVDP